MRTVEAVFLAAALAVLPVVVADAAETCTERFSTCHAKREESIR
jgi:hypothetical protein